MASVQRWWRQAPTDETSVARVSVLRSVHAALKESSAFAAAV